MKIKYDKYYTPKKLIKKCNKKLLKVIDFDKVDEFLDPCCGDNRWARKLKKLFPNKKFLSYDKYPDNDKIKYGDFLNEDLRFNRKRIIITNPPYGTKNTLTRRFIKKALLVCPYVCMLVPYSTAFSPMLPKPTFVFSFLKSFTNVVGVKVAMLVYINCNPYEKQKACNWYSDEEIRYKIFVSEVHRRSDVDKYIKDKRKRDLLICDWGCGTLFNITTIKKFYNKTMIIRFKNVKQKKKFLRWYKPRIKSIRANHIKKFGETTSLSYVYLRKLLYKGLGYKEKEPKQIKTLFG